MINDKTFKYKLNSTLDKIQTIECLSNIIANICGDGNKQFFSPKQINVKNDVLVIKMVGEMEVLENGRFNSHLNGWVTNEFENANQIHMESNGDFWCGCINGFENVDFYNDGEHELLHKHHYRCKCCGGIVQIG